MAATDSICVCMVFLVQYFSILIWLYALLTEFLLWISIFFVKYFNIIKDKALILFVREIVEDHSYVKMITVNGNFLVLHHLVFNVVVSKTTEMVQKNKSWKKNYHYIMYRLNILLSSAKIKANFISKQNFEMIWNIF